MPEIIIIIGGGPSGMMAAIYAAKAGNKVTLIEKNEKLGKKLFITGKGRCNITNNCAKDSFFENIVTNHKFLYSAYAETDCRTVQDFFLDSGLILKEERGNRIFPASDHSSDVIAALKKALIENNVEILLSTKVIDITVNEDKENNRTIAGVIIADKKKLTADKVIIATGGISYPSTGSTGDGYSFAEKFGHKIIKPLPALVPLTVKEPWCMDLQGLSLKNVAVVVKSKKKTIYQGFGEMLFTHFGLSGPLILSASSYYVKYIAKHSEISIRRYDSDIPMQEAEISIDLKPALSYEQLDKRLLRDFEANKNKSFKNILSGLLPSKLHPVITRLSTIAPDQKINEITKEERLNFVSLLKNLNLTINGTRGFNEAIITQGGVNIKDINPATMESKIIKNLYFAGEVLDIDALTGGFNLQAAWSTAALAGKTVSK